MLEKESEQPNMMPEMERIKTLKTELSAFLAEKLGIPKKSIDFEHGTAFPYRLTLELPRNAPIRGAVTIEQVKSAIEAFIEAHNNQVEPRDDAIEQSQQHSREWNQLFIGSQLQCAIDGVRTIIHISAFSSNPIIVNLAQA